MKFIDYVTIDVKAGNGGNGCVAFLREKFRPKGGPSGGDGGHGGNVILIGNAGISTLSQFRHGQRFSAENGGIGLGRKKRGKDGSDLLIQVPVGTTVYSISKESIAEQIADIVNPEDSIVL